MRRLGGRARRPCASGSSPTSRPGGGGLRLSRRAVAVAVGVLAVGLVTSWAALQPVRAAHAEDQAIDALDRRLRRRRARTRARAARRNPLSLEPLWLLAFIADARGDSRAASQALERAARLQPANAEAWRRLGRYRLSVLDEPRGALEAFQVAYFLDPAARRSASDVLEASRALKAQG